MAAHLTRDEVKEKLQERDNHLRESWVRSMETRLVREELTKCKHAEGVNHYVACKHLSELYINMLKENKLQGFVQVDT